MDLGHPVGRPLNVWAVLAILIVLFAITRYMRQQQTPDICLDDPTASVCEREIVNKREPRLRNSGGSREPSVSE